MKTLKNTYNIKLITPLRINFKKNNIITNDAESKYLLNERHKVENFFSLLKKVIKELGKKIN